jgi:pectate lyase
MLIENCSITVICLFVILQGSPSLALDVEPVGWATYNDFGLNGTTGGAGGETVIVTTEEELKDYIRRDEPYIILVQGTISMAQKDVHPNKTIIGIGTNPTLIGGFRIKRSNNVIVRNLIIRNSNYDGFSVEYDTHHVWIDHCDLSDCYDGLLDITHACDYVTVSWCRFSNHHKTCLLGHSNNNGDEDIGHLKVTYHHNWFDNTETRHPRVRFSYLTHVYNNYYHGNSYGIASTCDAEVLVEGCYFQNVGRPTLIGYGSSWDGDLVERNNIFVGSGSHETRGTVSEPSDFYSYTLDPAADVPAIVTAGAGLFPEEYDEPPTPNPMTWHIAPHAISSSTVTMTASTAYDYSGVEYYFDCLTPGGHDSGWQDSSTYTDSGLAGDVTYTYRVRARDKSVNTNQTDYSHPLSATTLSCGCAARLDSDIFSDCQVDVLDYAVFAEAWAMQAQPADINGDNNIDLLDLARLAADWLECNRDPATACWQ